LLLVAAADEGGDAGEVLDAAVILDGPAVTADTIGPAIAAGLLELDGQSLRFRHPLCRSAIYQAASLSRRQAAHAALAQALPGQPDRQAWHRAAAALRADEQVARELEDAAARAAQRGAAGVAAAALQRAAELSENPSSRGARILRAARLALESSSPELGVQLLNAAEQLELDAEDRVWL